MKHQKNSKDMKTMKNLIRWIDENETLTFCLISLFCLLLASVIPFGKVSIVLLFLGIPGIGLLAFIGAGLVIIGCETGWNWLMDKVR